MRTFCLLLSWQCLLVSGQFRQFQRPSTNNHDLLKQIVKSTPDEVGRLGDRYPGDRRTSILDRARFRPKSLRKPFERPSSARLSPSRVKSCDCDCEDLRTENDLLKQLVEKLSKQVEARQQVQQVQQVQQHPQPQHDPAQHGLPPMVPMGPNSLPSVPMGGGSTGDGVVSSLQC